MEQKEKRKTRADKKRDVKSVIELDLYECIARLSYISRQPIMVVGEKVILLGLCSRSVIEYLSPWFRRSYCLNDGQFQHVFHGDPRQSSPRVIRREGDRVRINLRVAPSLYEQLHDLSYALDLTVSSATGLLLDYAIRHTDIIQQYVEQYIREEIDEERVNQLHMVLDYLNKHNPYGEKITLTDIVDYVMEDAMDPNRNFKAILQEWISRIL